MHNRVFEGLKVLEFTTAVVGPLPGKCFSDYGATVVRVESSVHPDMVRLSPPYRAGASRINASAFWTQYNAGKYGVSLDLTSAEGRRVAERLARWSDVIIENFTPGVMERLKLSYDHLVKINPTLVMISISNLGRTGPCARHRGLGQPLQALCGLAHLLGWPDRGPDNPFGAIPDYLAAPFAVAVLVAALDFRRRTGKGQFIDMSQFEVSCSMLAPLLLDRVVNGREASRRGNRDPNAAPHGVYPCVGDDRWCAIAVFTDEEWAHFCQAIGKTELISDPRFATLEARKAHEDELNTIVSEWTGQRAGKEVMYTLQRAGVAAAVVNTPADLLSDPQLQHRSHFNIVDHPEIGPHRVVGQPSRLSATPAEGKRAPLLGEHNEVVLKNFLHMGEEEYVKLIVGNVLK